MDCPFKPGDKVRVKPSVEHPRYQWGRATRSSVGVVGKSAFGDLCVNFPEQGNWRADWSEMELVYGNEEED